MVSQEQEIRYPDYPLFKGLQKPLEFMGIHSYSHRTILYSVAYKYKKTSSIG